jgi:hypothetical protein
MIENDAELITIIEGPTPEFQPSPYLWFQSIYEGPEDADVLMCEMRTLNGQSILDRCTEAWREGRKVLLDFPDEMRLRQQIDVVAMRLQEIEAGMLLHLWVRQMEEEVEEEGFDDADEDYGR